VGRRVAARAAGAKQDRLHELASGPAFHTAARRLQLSTMGFFQYIGPSFMFVFGVWLFGETLAPARLLTFCFIWVALAVYSADALRHSRQSHQNTPLAP
jgi:drug/metabolite transporter (DMT)-like permease